MKKAITLFLLIALIAAFPASAADLYGRVWVANSKPAVGAIVSIDCPATQSQHATVDKYGRYRLTRLPAQKNCHLNVEFPPQRTKSIAVYSGSGSKNINIELHRTANGLTLIFR